MAYTRYVLDAGHSGDFLDLMAALAPCVLEYGEIGARLLAASHDAAYADWIETYGGEDYQQVCRDVGTLIDDAVLRRLGEQPTKSPRWAGLCKRFATATWLEAGFWQMGLNRQQAAGQNRPRRKKWGRGHSCPTVRRCISMAVPQLPERLFLVRLILILPRGNGPAFLARLAWAKQQFCACWQG
jgi:hypothetical protein